MLVRLRRDEAGEPRPGEVRAIISILRPEGLEAEGLPETIAAMIKAEMPFYISVPGPPGFQATVADVGEALTLMAMAKKMSGIRAILREVYADIAGDPLRPSMPGL